MVVIQKYKRIYRTYRIMVSHGTIRTRVVKLLENGSQICIIKDNLSYWLQIEWPCNMNGGTRINKPQMFVLSALFRTEVLASRMKILALLLPAVCLALDNGVGRRPPMGWSSWNPYHSGQMDLNEATIQRQADAGIQRDARCRIPLYQHRRLLEQRPRRERHAAGL